MFEFQACERHLGMVILPKGDIPAGQDGGNAVRSRLSAIDLTGLHRHVSRALQRVEVLTARCDPGGVDRFHDRDRLGIAQIPTDRTEQQ